MKHKTRFMKARQDESGAVTVDWVVLAAALVVVTIATSNSISRASNDTTNKIGDYIQSQGAALDNATF